LAITNPDALSDRLFPKYISFLLDFKLRFASRQACQDFLKACKEQGAVHQPPSTIPENESLPLNEVALESQLAKLYHQLDQCDRSSYATPIRRRLLLSEFLALKNKMYPTSKTGQKDKLGTDHNEQFGIETFEYAADIGNAIYPSSFPQQIDTNIPAQRRLQDVHNKLMETVFGKDSPLAKSKLKRKQLIQRLHLARPWLLLEKEYGSGALALIPKGCG